MDQGTRELGQSFDADVDLLDRLGELDTVDGVLQEIRLCLTRKDVPRISYHFSGW